MSEFPPPPPPTSQPNDKKIYEKWWFWVIAAFVALTMVAIATAPADDPEVVEPTPVVIDPAPTTPEVVEPTVPEVIPTPIPEVVEVPGLGLTLGKMVGANGVEGHRKWLEYQWEEYAESFYDVRSCPDGDHWMTEDGVCAICEAKL